MDNRQQAQHLIDELYNELIKRPDQVGGLIDITDVLLQVYKKLDDTKAVEPLVNRLVNYIYSVGFANKIHFDRKQEHLLIELGDIAKAAGWNGLNRANYSDKMQFYSVFDPKPTRFP